MCWWSEERHEPTTAHQGEETGKDVRRTTSPKKTVMTKDEKCANQGRKNEKRATSVLGLGLVLGFFLLSSLSAMLKK